MKVFFKFIREFCSTFWLARSVLIALVGVIVACAFLYTLTEDINFRDALYMSFITAFTIGYGDFVPLTSWGKVLSVFVGFVGMIFIGLSVAIATIALRNTAPNEDR